MERIRYVYWRQPKKSRGSKAVFSFVPMTKNHQRAEVSVHIAREVASEISKETCDMARDISTKLVYALAHTGEQ